jgi:hypothetical protein
MKQPCVSIELSFFTRFMACNIFSLRCFMYGNLMYIIPFFLLCMNSIGIIIHVSSSRSFFRILTLKPQAEFSSGFQKNTHSVLVHTIHKNTRNAQ